MNLVLGTFVMRRSIVVGGVVQTFVKANTKTEAMCS
jgi:hypothetical protein